MLLFFFRSDCPALILEVSFSSWTSSLRNYSATNLTKPPSWLPHIGQFSTESGIQGTIQTEIKVSSLRLLFFFFLHYSSTPSTSLPFVLLLHTHTLTHIHTHKTYTKQQQHEVRIHHFRDSDDGSSTVVVQQQPCRRPASTTHQARHGYHPMFQRVSGQTVVFNRFCICICPERKLKAKNRSEMLELRVSY